MDMEGEILWNEAIGRLLDIGLELREEIAEIKAAILAKESGHTEKRPREIRAVVEAEKKAKRERVKKIADEHEIESFFDSLKDVSHEVGTPICRRVERLTDKRLLERARRRRLL